MNAHSELRVIGVDLSLTATGIATINGAETISTKFDGYELNRFRAIVARVSLICEHADLVMLEGLSYGSHTGKAAERGALHWMVRDQLDLADVPVAIVPPTSRARYATSKGNAGKDAVMIACVQRIPIMVTNNNEADAAILLTMGLDHLGHPLVTMPAHHRAALNGVTWPTSLAVAS
jgi:crossover junction endodeoxyribonuclease RuvC